ncbi:hypothetical protein [Neorhodopirellula pilleata]|uniref:Uncharacterized protein n=1 Tax=Neorhodopirellula pilleata TaxID=2714738 RepID=A0A5C6A1V5_9BACT|nr:hypothetical protein [Neorhodopirellula pilleata]TWT92483.1 hypothetical protein Pla100_45010 [Neorhodopirellula pilleata]
MLQQQKLKIATVVMALILAGLVASQTLQQNRSTIQAVDSNSIEENVPALTVGEIAASASTSEVSEDVSQRNSRVGALRVGRIGATPTLEEIQSLQKLPLLDSQVNRAYTLAKSMTCRMLTPGASVNPTISLPLAGEAGTIGRVPAFTIGLTMDPNGRNKLPAVTRRQVDDYFEKHRLVIEPMIYSNDQGQLYFGTDCQAAFYEIDRPGVAVKAEPMIESAVERFRSLGIAASIQTNEDLKSSLATRLNSKFGRTLVMAFTFEQAALTVTSIGQEGRRVTELLFFHLPPSQPEPSDAIGSSNSRNPILMEVFLTSDERRNLHRLDRREGELNAPTPDILSDVRFDKMILMGLYPAEPVVTDIHYRSGGIIDMELVSQLMNGYKDQPPMSLDDVLDQFGLLSGASLADQPIPSMKVNGTTEEDERWLREVARLKYERLEKSLQPVERADQPAAFPKVPLMTGLGK